ncbi:MAG: MATE family efflux transporter [Prevotellaceae bacterium]|nr:MATE family efflux transporter [Prevotellaceae bacterium]
MKQDSNNQKTLELGTRPVGRLLVEYALPAIIAMTASSLYNMVDSIFIGQGVGALAISGLAVTFPFMNLSAAFGAAVGVGASSYISVKLGQKDYAKALRVFGNTVTLNVIIGILFSTISLLLLDPILYFFGASDQTISYAREYMIIILLGNVITHLYFGMNAVLRSASKPRAAMFIIIFTVVLNTLLDPLFIYTFDLGIAGAAYATILAQLLAFLWQLKLFSDKREILHLQRGIYKPSLRIIRNIFAIGMSPFFMNACACIIVIFINKNLLTYGGDLAVGAYGIANRVAFIFVMVTMGVNQGMQPIAGYNYGAQKFDRLLRVLKLAMISATCVTTSGFLVAEFCPRLCVSLFTDDAQLTSLSINGLRILMAAMPIVGYQMVITNFFQSIGMAKISIVLSLSRQLLLLLPLLILLPPYFGIDGVWMSMPVSDTLSALLAFVVMSRYMKKFTMLHQQLNVLS